MADDYTKALVREITIFLSQYFKQFREPVVLSILQSKYSFRLQRAFGYGTTMSWLTMRLEAAGVLKTFLTRSAARWIMLRADWEALGPEDKERVSNWLLTARDPRLELREARSVKRKSTTD